MAVPNAGLPIKAHWIVNTERAAWRGESSKSDARRVLNPADIAAEFAAKLEMTIDLGTRQSIRRGHFARFDCRRVI
jgi:hypothetical protein